VIDCKTGDLRLIDNIPFKIGKAADSAWRIEDRSSVVEDDCVIQQRGLAIYLLPMNGGKLLLDGVLGTGGELSPDEDHTLVMGETLFALRIGHGLKQWLAGMDPKRWYIYNKRNATKHGPCSFSEIPSSLRSVVGSVEEAILFCEGMAEMGFYSEQVFPQLIGQTFNGSAAAPPLPGTSSESQAINAECGEFTCPVCWLKFDRGDTMNVAVHASLRGDPILGESQMQRFYATRFNDRGQAVDAMSIPSPDLACPHCRRKLPPGFLDMPHHIFSIVGAPSSGKSYYLSVLVKMLQNTLFKHFGCSFRDADPSENVVLNQMKTQLFSASSVQEAVLAKTELEGAMYETLPRLGRKVRLPKPFIFNVSNPRDSTQDFSVVFYDNAGEHFEPTRNSADSPGAQHIAAASGIFFLFDPLHNTDFQRRLVGLNDPQLDSRRVDQQDIILAESEVRIKSLLGLDSRQRIATPLAVIVGKSDTWVSLLGSSRIQYAVENGRLDLDIVRANSSLVRDLLLEVTPAIVANAEAISSDVMYFAASPLGCSPVEFTDSRGITMIGPDPSKLNPQHVEIPTLWVLSKVASGMVRTKEGKS
jgi:hypothetical protein